MGQVLAPRGRAAAYQGVGAEIESGRDQLLSSTDENEVGKL